MPKYKLDLTIEADLPNMLVAQLVAQHFKGMVSRELERSTPETKDALAQMQAAGISLKWGQVSRMIT